MKKIIALAVVCAALMGILGLSGCSGGDKSLKTVRDRGLLRIMVVENGGRYSSSAPSGDMREGIEIEIARQIAADLEVEAEFITAAKEDIPGLFNDSEADLAIGRIAVSDSLRYNYAVSLSYATGRLFAVTPRGLYFPSPGSLENKSFGLTDQISAPLEIELTGISGSSKVKYSSVESVETNLSLGTIAAYICYEEQAMELIGIPTLQVQNMIGAGVDYYAVVGRKGAEELMAAVNRTIQRLLEEDQIARYFEAYP